MFIGMDLWLLGKGLSGVIVDATKAKNYGLRMAKACKTWAKQAVIIRGRG